VELTAIGLSDMERENAARITKVSNRCLFNAWLLENGFDICSESFMLVKLYLLKALKSFGS
jgi:hypothetical protein